MKSGPLSDSAVIEKINDKFIPLEINITDDGFPAVIPALKLWEKAYGGNRGFKVAFATTVVVEPKGKYPLGTSGSGYLGDFDKAINYHSDKYQKFLDESLDRGRRAREIETDATLTTEERATRHRKLIGDILKSIQQANQGGGK